jgi:hypothetical protein
MASLGWEAKLLMQAKVWTAFLCVCMYKTLPLTSKIIISSNGDHDVKVLSLLQNMLALVFVKFYFSIEGTLWSLSSQFPGCIFYIFIQPELNAVSAVVMDEHYRVAIPKEHPIPVK